MSSKKNIINKELLKSYFEELNHQKHLKILATDTNQVPKQKKIYLNCLSTDKKKPKQNNINTMKNQEPKKKSFSLYKKSVDKNPFNLQGNNINSNNNIKLNPNNSNEVNNLNNENLISNNFENNNNININERPQEINNIIQGMSYIPQPISSIPRNNVSEDISDLPKIINNIPEGNQGNNENINPFDNFPIQNQDINNNQNSYDENEFFLCFIVNQNNQIFLNVGPMTPFKQILVDLKKKYEYLNRMDVKSFRFNNLLIPMDSNSIENGLEKGDKIYIGFGNDFQNIVMIIFLAKNLII